VERGPGSTSKKGFGSYPGQHYRCGYLLRHEEWDKLNKKLRIEFYVKTRSEYQKIE